MAGISGEIKSEILAKVKAGKKVVELSQQYGVSTTRKNHETNQAAGKIFSLPIGQSEY